MVEQMPEQQAPSEQKTRLGKSLTRRRWLAPVSWVVLLLGVPSLLYVAYVAGKLQDLSEHNLRTLGNAAGQIERALDNAGATARNLAKDFGYACEFLLRQPRLSLVEPTHCTDLEDFQKSDQAESRLEAAAGGRLLLVTDIPDLSSADLADTGSSPGTSFQLEVRLDQILADVPLEGAFDHLVIVEGDGQVVVQRGPDALRLTSLAKLTTTDSIKLSVADLQSASRVTQVHYAEQDYGLLCQPLRPPSDLVQRDQDDTLGSTWVLCGLVSSERSVANALAVSPLLVLILLLLLLLGLLTWPFFKIFTMRQRERLRFLDGYLLSVSTFGLLLLMALLLLDFQSYASLRNLTKDRLAALAADLDRHLVGELQQMARQLDAYDEIVAATAVNLGGLRTDVKLLRQRKSTSAQAPAATAVPVSEAVPVLDDSEPDAIKGLDLPYPDHYPHLSSVFWMRPDDGRQFIKATINDRNTPPVALSKRAYFQRVQDHDRLWRLSTVVDRWSSGDTGEPWDSEVYVEPIRSVTTGESSVVLSTCSRIRAEGSDDSPKGECPKPGERVVAALSTPLVSIADPVMGPGFGFAIIDDDGNVLLHSDSRRALADNLFDELSQPRRLRAALESRTDRAIESDYLSRPHRLWIRPMRGLPWTVVTFFDKEVLRTANLEVLTQAIVIGTLYLVVFYLIPSVIYLSRRRRHTSWLWPDGSKLRLYKRLVWMYGVLFLALLLVLHVVPRGYTLIAGFLFPLTAVVITVLRIRLWNRQHLSVLRGTKGVKGSDRAGLALDIFPQLLLAAVILSAPQRMEMLGSVISVMVLTFVVLFYVALRWSPKDGRVRLRLNRAKSLLPDEFLPWHDVAAVLFWLLVAVLPASCFFKVALEDQQLLLLKMEHLHLRDQLERRDCAVDERYRRVSVGQPGFLANRKIFVGGTDAYQASTSITAAHYAGEAVFEDLRSELAKPVGERWYSDLLADHEPLYNDTSVRLRYLAPPAASDSSWQWRRRVDGEVMFEVDRSRCSEPYVLLSSVPLAMPAVGGLVLAGGLLSTMVLLAWVRWVSRRLLFARLEQQVRRLRPEDLIRGEIRTNVLALLASPIDRRAIMASNRYDYVALGDEDSLARALEVEGKPKPVVCDGFEDGLEDPVARRSKLQVLEDLVLTHHRRVLILTSVDPFNDLFSFASPGHDAPTSAPASGAPDDDEQRRWGRLLSRFTLVPVALARQQATAVGSDGADDLESTDSMGGRPAWLERELNATLHLRRLVEQRQGLSSDAVSHISRREALERIVESAEGYYWALWTACSRDEKLVLVQLAEERLVNPKQNRTVRRLLQRGLVVRDPMLRPMNESFTLFVSLIRLPQEVREWEQPSQGMGWTHIRWAFMALLVVIALFLSTTQKQLLETTFGFVSALGISLPVLLKLVSSVNKPSPGGLDG